MRASPRLFVFAAFFPLYLLLLTCGGSGPSPQPTLSPPPVAPRLDVHGRGSLALSIEPGQAQIIDTAALAAQAGTVPPCSRFVFLFSWQVDRPSGIRIVGDDGDGSFEVVSGASGEASIGGCVALEALNESDEIVVGELLYFIAESGNEP